MKSIIFGKSTPVSLVDSLYITIVSLSMVFFILILISMLLYLLKYLPQEKQNIKKEQVKEVKNNTRIKPEDVKDEKMRIALMVASIECAKENENAFIRVKSIREIK